MTRSASGRADPRERLAASAARVTRLARAAGPPAAGAWSAREVILHLVAVEVEVWQARLDDLETKPEPTWAWTEPGLWAGPGSGSVEEALVEFGAQRAGTVARLGRLDALGWRRHGTHATFGRLDVAGLLAVALEHDEEHALQLEGLRRRDD